MSEGFIDTLWYLGRGTGVVSLVLLTVSLVLGIGSRSGRPVFGLPRFAVALVHRNASLIAIGLVLIHMTSLFLDPYARLRLLDLIVPFAAAYRPVWVGFGTLAAELLILVVVSSLLRQRIGVGAWRGIHWTSYALWPLAWLHGFFTGSDAGSFWLRLVVIACAVAVGAAGVWRFLPQFAEGAGTRVQPTRGQPALAGLAGLVASVRQKATRSAPSATERPRSQRSTAARSTSESTSEFTSTSRSTGRSTSRSRSRRAGSGSKWRTTPPLAAVPARRSTPPDPDLLRGAHSPDPDPARGAHSPDADPARGSHSPDTGPARGSHYADPEPARGAHSADPEPRRRPTTPGRQPARWSTTPADADPGWHSTQTGSEPEWQSTPPPDTDPRWHSTPTGSAPQWRSAQPSDTDPEWRSPRPSGTEPTWRSPRPSDTDPRWHSTPTGGEPEWRSQAPDTDPRWPSSPPDNDPRWPSSPPDNDPRWPSSPPDNDPTWQERVR